MSEHEPECWIVSHSNPLNGCICTEITKAIGRARWQALDDACSAVAVIPAGKYAITDALIALHNLRSINK